MGPGRPRWRQRASPGAPAVTVTGVAVRDLAARVLPAPGPHRALSATFLVDGVGTGLWLAANILYLTGPVGLPTGQVAAGLSIAGVVGLAGSVPLGRVGDRYGLRRVGVALHLVQAAAMVGYALLGSFPAFVLTSCGFMLAQRGGNAVRNALLGASVPTDDRLRVRAYCRSAANVGLAAGALVAAPILAADTRPAYLVAVLGNGASFVLAAILLARLGRVPPRPRAVGESRWGALRDTRYLTMTVMTGVLSIHRPVLGVALPLWVADHTDAPRALVAALVAVNTALTIALQVPLSRGADGSAGGARTLRRSGLTLAVACVILAAAAGRPAALASALLVAGVAVLTVGELWQSAGGWGLSYDLAPADRHGQYQGVYALGNGVRDAVGPIAVTALVLRHGTAGWLVLAAGFAAFGLALRPILAALGRTGPEPLAER